MDPEPVGHHGLVRSATRPVFLDGVPNTVGGALERAAERHGEGTALVGSSGRISFAELDTLADHSAGALRARSIEPGDRVAACLPNDLDIVLAFLGCMRAGAIWVGLPKALARPEKKRLLEDSGSRIFLTDSAGEDEARGFSEEIAHLDEVLGLAPDGGSWLALASGTDPAERRAVDPHEPAAIAYTSGTTGFPKGAVHSQHNLLLPGAVAASRGFHGNHATQGVVLPLTILNLMVLAPLAALQEGNTCVCIDQMDATGIADWVRREQVSHVALVPTMVHDLLTNPVIDPNDLVSLQRPGVGGATCPVEIQDLYRERFGAGVQVGYGMTEAPTAVTWSNPEEDPEPGLCGQPLPQVAISIRDDANRSVARGKLGEICVGPAKDGPWAGVYTPMLGYWNRPDESEEALRGGWYHTGDLGHLAGDGNLFFRGRLKELIVRGGANVYPADVERVLLEHPAVADCAVLGIPDRRLGERVVAVVTLATRERLDVEALQRWTRERVAAYKVPSEIVCRDGLPRNTMGKVLKRELVPLFRNAPD